MCMIRSGNVRVTGHKWMCQRLGDVHDWMGQCMGDYVHDGMGDYVHEWMGQRMSDYVHDWMGQRMGDCGMGRRGEATGREKGHSLSPCSCPATRSAPSKKFGY